jgi:hypothetical protein
MRTHAHRLVAVASEIDPTIPLTGRLLPASDPAQKLAYERPRRRRWRPDRRARRPARRGGGRNTAGGGRRCTLALYSRWRWWRWLTPAGPTGWSVGGTLSRSAPLLLRRGLRCDEV